MITFITITNIYNECLEKACSHIPLEKWQQQPIGVGLDTHKSKYGRVFSDGRVVINPAFLGTEAVNKLKETILHELAHLIVGLENNHNKKFRRVENVLCAHIKVTEEERQQVKINNGYKYRLLAFGQKKTYDLGGANRRTKKYLNYNPETQGYMSIRNDRLTRFEYAPFADELPEGTITELTF